MRFTYAIGLAAAVLLSPVSSSATPKSGEEIVSKRIHETRDNLARKIGIMAGARAHCGYDPKPFLTNYKMHLEMNYQAPQMDWDRILNGANQIMESLAEANAPCTSELKTYLERLAY